MFHVQWYPQQSDIKYKITGVRSYEHIGDCALRLKLDDGSEVLLWHGSAIIEEGSA